MKYSFSDFMFFALTAFALFVLISLPFLLASRVLLSHPTSQVILTDTGDSIPYDPDTCNIIESTGTIVVDVEGSIVSYSYNDWYYIDTVELPSLWDRFLTFLREVPSDEA